MPSGRHRAKACLGPDPGAARHQRRTRSSGAGGDEQPKRDQVETLREGMRHPAALWLLVVGQPDRGHGIGSQLHGALHRGPARRTTHRRAAAHREPVSLKRSAPERSSRHGALSGQCYAIAFATLYGADVGGKMGDCLGCGKHSGPTARRGSRADNFRDTNVRQILSLYSLENQ